LTEVLRQLQAGNAMQGVQDGGYGQLITARALAGQNLERQRMAQNAYLQSIGQGGQMLSQMPNTIGERFGTSGAAGQGLSQLAMLYALRQRQPQQQQQTQVGDRGYGSYDMGFNPGLVNRPGGGMMGGNQQMQPMSYQSQGSQYPWEQMPSFGGAEI